MTDARSGRRQTQGNYLVDSLNSLPPNTPWVRLTRIILFRRFNCFAFAGAKKTRSVWHVFGKDFLDEEVKLLLGDEIAALLVDRHDWGILDAPDDPRAGGA